LCWNKVMYKMNSYGWELGMYNVFEGSFIEIKNK